MTDPLADTLAAIDRLRVEHEQLQQDAELRKRAEAYLVNELKTLQAKIPDDLIADGYHIVHHGMYRDNHEDGSQQWWHYIAVARGDRIYGARGKDMGDALDQIRREIAEGGEARRAA